MKPGMSRRTSAFESFADETQKVSSFPVGGSFGEEGLLHALDILDNIPVLKIPGVPLPPMHIPIMAGTTRAVMDVFKSSDNSSSTSISPNKSSSTARRVVAKSKLYVVELKNKVRFLL